MNGVYDDTNVCDDANAEEEISEDKRQSSEKIYQHPPDIPMSIMYNQIAQNNFDSDPFGILPVRKTGMGFGYSKKVFRRNKR